MALINDEKTQLQRVEQALLRKFGDRVQRETICAEVEAAKHEFDQARIRIYVPILLQKQVTDVLRTRRT